MPTWNGPGALAGAHGAGEGIAARRSDPDNIATGQIPAGSRGLLLRDWRPIANAGALLGRATVELPVVGLVISDIGVFANAGGKWAQLPAEAQRDRDGQIIRDERGKTKYRSALRWRDHALQAAFSHALIEAIERQHGPLGDRP